MHDIKSLCHLICNQTTRFLFVLIIFQIPFSVYFCRMLICFCCRLDYDLRGICHPHKINRQFRSNPFGNIIGSVWDNRDFVPINADNWQRDHSTGHALSRTYMAESSFGVITDGLRAQTKASPCGEILFSRAVLRGTQREYSSKPLKQSIVKRILVFKR